MVKFGDIREGAWGFGQVQYRKCDDWNNNNPISCSTNAQEEGVDPRGFIKCALGSSPGGAEPGNGATLCSPMSLDNNCEGGQNCYVVTDTSKMRKFPNGFKFMIVVYVIMALCILSLVSYIYFKENAKEAFVGSF